MRRCSCCLYWTTSCTMHSGKADWWAVQNCPCIIADNDLLSSLSTCERTTLSDDIQAKAYRRTSYGEEGSVIGSAAAWQPQDQVFTQYRGKMPVCSIHSCLADFADRAWRFIMARFPVNVFSLKAMHLEADGRLQTRRDDGSVFRLGQGYVYQGSTNACTLRLSGIQLSPDLQSASYWYTSGVLCVLMTSSLLRYGVGCRRRVCSQA